MGEIYFATGKKGFGDCNCLRAWGTNVELHEALSKVFSRAFTLNISIVCKPIITWDMEGSLLEV